MHPPGDRTGSASRSGSFRYDVARRTWTRARRAGGRDDGPKRRRGERRSATHHRCCVAGSVAASSRRNATRGWAHAARGWAHALPVVRPARRGTVARPVMRGCATTTPPAMMHGPRRTTQPHGCPGRRSLLHGADGARNAAPRDASGDWAVAQTIAHDLPRWRCGTAVLRAPRCRVSLRALAQRYATSCGLVTPPAALWRVSKHHAAERQSSIGSPTRSTICCSDVRSSTSRIAFLTSSMVRRTSQSASSTQSLQGA